jgi:hypothetical protein
LDIDTTPRTDSQHEHAGSEKRQAEESQAAAALANLDAVRADVAE